MLPHHFDAVQVALLWEDISQRVGTWTQPSTDFFQALYALKAAKTVRLVRKKDLAFALSRLAATRRELGEILSARLQSWSDKCVVEANRNMVVKLEATGREDFAGIFAELNAALKVARQYVVLFLGDPNRMGCHWASGERACTRCHLLMIEFRACLGTKKATLTLTSLTALA